MCAVQPRPDVQSTRTGGGHGFEVRLVMISHDLTGDHSGAVNRLAKECLGTGRIAVVTQQDVHDHAVFVDRAIQVPLLALAEEEHLIDEPPPADRMSLTT